MRLIVAGSRTIQDREFVQEKFEDAITIFNPDEIVHGGALGVDSLAGEIADELGFRVKVFKADWKKYGKRAGMLRNKQMADYADALLALWDWKSSGTKNMILTMRKLGKPVRVEIYGELPEEDLWSRLGKADAICITTNGFVTRGKKAVMGRGCALQAKILFSGIEILLAQGIEENGNVVQPIYETKGTTIVSFPVKPSEVVFDGSNVVEHAKSKFQLGDTVPGFYAKADIAMIKKSALELLDLIQAKGWNEVVLPLPGTGAGELDKKEVLETLKEVGLLEKVNLFPKEALKKIKKKSR